MNTSEMNHSTTRRRSNHIAHQATERITTQTANNHYQSVPRGPSDANLSIIHEPIFTNEVKPHNFTKSLFKVVKVLPRTGHEGPEGE